MSISCLIVNFNNKKITNLCIQSLLGQALKDFEVVLVENGSSEEERAVGEGLTNFKQVVLNKNYGFPAGVNLGVRSCAGEWVLVLNNDCQLRKDFMMAVKDATAQGDKYQAYSPKIYQSSGQTRRFAPTKENGNVAVIYACGDEIDEKGLARNIGRGEVDRGQYDAQKEVPLASFACILIKKELLERFPLDESFSPGYYEDVDFCLRVQKAGYKIGFLADAVCWHFGEASFGKLNLIENEMHQFRNLSFTVAKHFSWSNIVRHYAIFNLRSLRYYFFMKRRPKFLLIEKEIIKRFFLRLLKLLSFLIIFCEYCIKNI